MCLPQQKQQGHHFRPARGMLQGANQEEVAKSNPPNMPQADGPQPSIPSPHLLPSLSAPSSCPSAPGALAPGLFITIHTRALQPLEHSCQDGDHQRTPRMGAVQVALHVTSSFV
eukprot:TRINITY_DN6506_c0_g3_i1.p2 TRINITY_DN6506_c0_g3~~TRINITY_DN6506_c0_g3_i1.p2  ORF type:complete len:114 (-),score=21.23 TRINITY_DN6506_c0_g3_i1:80-421(-)